MPSKLKLCPICGACPAIYGIATDNGLIWRLRACGQTKDYLTLDAAHEAWNRAVQEGAIDAEYTKKFLGNLEPGDGVSGTANNMSSAGLYGIAGESVAADFTGGARDDECGA